MGTRKVIGLWGGIGSGKTTVCSALEGQPFRVDVINADQLGHAAYAPGEAAVDEIAAAFGSEVRAEDGGINRRALGALVFGSEAKMKTLTDIVWPIIKQKARQRIDELKASPLQSDQGQLIILEAAVLLEASWDELVDEVWVTMVDEAIAKERIMKRNKLDEDAATKRLSSQMSNEERLAKLKELHSLPHVVIWTNRELSSVENDVLSLARKTLNLTLD
ncbi:unnamed protein product [Vitrella brassicaformis CCMP3155]|uniref:Dephospho-CoA kinase n=1 Tax=Vitrella brassicaformis (strain CCMP3155) TaxID=1169540 RepID=A0A0G4EL54_VITBC|nr:unnamed protein product [Vitrella brassicaformis CCMP3155]|mmetsp:Transcript_45102/g.112038  ORF Transcript_45102/g.112038 Transcript_45102/m.112038 type:complete len:219 (-) Transcript_45102:29-685(-)|eukprot:CEL98141.1 unnamed protein product [Vitrella brassicaformis CCMP3155]